MYMTGLDITAETQNMKTEEPQSQETAATAVTKLKLPTLIATSVVRGLQQGESHGGFYLVNFANQQVDQVVASKLPRRDIPSRANSS